MRHILEHLLVVGGAILVWGKIGSITLGLALILYACWRFNTAMRRIRLLKT